MTTEMNAPTHEVRMRLVQPCKVSITRVHHRRLTEAYIGHEKLAHQPVIVLVLQETASLWLELRANSFGNFIGRGRRQLRKRK